MSKPETVHVNCRLWADLLVRVDEFARKERRNRSDAIRVLLEDALDAREAVTYRRVAPEAAATVEGA